MKTAIKMFVLKVVAVSALTAGAYGTATAAVCDIYGNCVPVCHNVWVQTGPYVGQGYWMTVCN